MQNHNIIPVRDVTFDAITGVPQAIASNGGNPNPS